MSFVPHAKNLVSYYKSSVRAASTVDLALSGLSAIDGVTPIAGDRILVKNQSTPSQNGIYVAAAGSWSRASDADQNTEVKSGFLVYVSEGSSNSSKQFLLTTTDPITVGTTALTFSAAGAGITTAGSLGSNPNSSGLTITGSSINLEPADLTFGGYLTASGQSIGGFKTFDVGIIVNESGADSDTRIEGDTDANLIYIDAGNNQVGIGTATPSAKLNVEGTVIINDLGADVDFRVEGDTATHLLFIDASTDNIGINQSTPTSRLHIAGSIAKAIASVSTNTTLDATHHTVLVDASGGARTITLPAAANASGRVYVIKKIDSSGNNVTIDADSSETIDDATTQIIGIQFESLTIQSDGTEWWIV
jgi:hypothetical protein